MNHPHKTTLQATPETTFSTSRGHDNDSSNRLPREDLDNFPPFSHDSEAWGLGHKRVLLYWAVYIAIFTSLMMLFL